VQPESKQASWLRGEQRAAKQLRAASQSASQPVSPSASQPVSQSAVPALAAAACLAGLALQLSLWPAAGRQCYCTTGPLGCWHGAHHSRAGSLLNRQCPPPLLPNISLCSARPQQLCQVQQLSSQWRCQPLGSLAAIVLVADCAQPSLCSQLLCHLGGATATGLGIELQAADKAAGW